MNIHDISLTVSEKTITWENTEQGFSKVWTSELGNPGESCNVSVLTHWNPPRCPAALYPRR